MERPDRSTILLVGVDGELRYLMERFAQRGGFQLQLAPRVSSMASAPDRRKPAAVWFLSLPELEESRSRGPTTAVDEAPVIVFVSRTDELRASELGADHCVGQPLTYPGFLAALRAVGVDTPAAPSTPMPMAHEAGGQDAGR